MKTRRDATVNDLSKIEGKAEIVNGELVIMTPGGGLHGYAVGEIFASLREYARRTGSGHAIADNVGFIVNLPTRRSFSPDAAFYTGALTRGFLEGAPVFAVEVRSEEDYGPRAEAAIAAKRADYFAAGTLAVWDVDVLRDVSVKVYRATDRLQPTTYRPGDLAEAEPAVPGWTLAVSDLLPRQS